MKIKKNCLTLLEIMIVILLITIITGVIGYNMKGALDKGRAFRTERAREQLQDMLLYCLASNGKMTIEQIIRSPLEALESIGLVKNPAELLKDGWGVPFVIKPTRSKNDFEIQSERFLKYQKEHHLALSEERESDLADYESF